MQKLLSVLRVLKRSFGSNCTSAFTSGDKITFKEERDVFVVHVLQQTLLSSFKLEHLEDVAFELNEWLPHLCVGSLTSTINRKLIIVLVIWACEFWCWRNNEKDFDEKKRVCQHLCAVLFDLCNMLKHVSEHSYVSMMITDHSEFNSYIEFVISEHNTQSEKALCSIHGPSLSVPPILRKLLMQRGVEHLTLFQNNLLSETLTNKLSKTTLVLSRKALYKHGCNIHFLFSVDRPTTVNVCVFLHSDTSIQEKIELCVMPNTKTIVKIELMSPLINLVLDNKNTCFLAKFNAEYGVGFTSASETKITLHPLDDLVCAFSQPESNYSLANKNTSIIDGRLFVCDEKKRTTRFTLLDSKYGHQRCSLPYFTHVGVGNTHYVASTRDGAVWVWGENTHKQFGYDFITKTEIPHVINLPRKVKVVASGHLHSVALMDDGTVYSWGDNSKKQLGHMTSKIYKVRDLKNIRFISSGAYHNFAITYDDVAFGWGDNTFGKVDCSNSKKQIRVPKLIDTGVAAISAGVDHSIVLTSGGDVHTWGDNTHAQLGGVLEKSTKRGRVCWRPPYTETCLDVVAAEKHSMVLTDAGVYYCGTRNTKTYKTFSLFKSKNKYVAIGPSQAMTDRYKITKFNTY